MNIPPHLVIEYGYVRAYMMMRYDSNKTEQKKIDTILPSISLQGMNEHLISIIILLFQCQWLSSHQYL